MESTERFSLYVMGSRIRISIALWIVFLACATGRVLDASEPCAAYRVPQEKWTWRDGSGEHTAKDLDDKIQQHTLWLRSKGKAGARADLHDADLHGAYLESVDLSEALLQRANLHDTCLNKANLQWADLTEAELGLAEMRQADLRNATLLNATPFSADLRGARLTNANLTKAVLSNAILDGADLTSANLSEAKLEQATLRNADLTGARLDGALVNQADLAGVMLESKSLPELREIAAALNIDSLRYRRNPDRLVDLAREFKEEGFSEQERKVVYARREVEAGLLLQKCRTSPRDVSDCGEYVFRKGFFDFTCRYGMSRIRPLKIVLWLWLVCSIIYFVISHFNGESALYRLDKLGSPRNPVSSDVAHRVRAPRMADCRWRYRQIEFLWREVRVFGTTMFFSAMSMFNIGFRDIDFGKWIRLLTRHEYDIKAVGWARVLAGWQSLASVYLIALWVLIYFGHPFE